MKRLVLLILLFFIFLTLYLYGQEFKEEAQKYWVFFTDKGSNSLKKSEQSYKELETRFTPRALQRRAKVRTPGNFFDHTDLPVSEVYINELLALNLRPVVTSKWLNAVSVLLYPEQVEQVLSLPFVRKVQRVAYFYRRPVLLDKASTPVVPELLTNKFSLDYGESFVQNALMKVPEVHDLGINGTGVLICMLDTGFNYQYHEALKHIKVRAEHDFINGDGITQNEEGQDIYSQHNHGTMTLAALGGFHEGALIGPAYGVSFVLAKTENVASETPIEEDFWVAGVEWADSLGADLVSSSLGYNDWYQYSDMDGNTAVTTIAADLATSKGILVVNSAGNEGNSSWRYVIAPADGDSVIAVGAVDSQGLRVGFSSMGPTFDGRIKPDVMAMGLNVQTVSPNSDSGYAKASGTSLACPLTAGVAALVLSAHPYLTPMEIRDALRETASRAQDPDNFYGWGVVNAYEAVLYHGLAFSNLPKVEIVPDEGFQVIIKVVSKAGLSADSILAFYSVEAGPFNKIQLYPTGEPYEYAGVIPLSSFDNLKVEFYFLAVDLSGERGYLPWNAPDSLFSFFTSDTSIQPVSPPREFYLYQNYPNPFRDHTTIGYDLYQSAVTRLEVYDIRGRLVCTLVHDRQRQGKYRNVRWYGTDARGQPVASGMYFVKLTSGEFSRIKKMILLR